MNRKIYIAFVKVQLCLVCMMLLIGLNACATQSAALSVNQSGGGVDIFSLSVDAQRAYQQSRWFDAVRLYQEIVEPPTTELVSDLIQCVSLADSAQIDRHFG